jgi:hypothetical protein
VVLLYRVNRRPLAQQSLFAQQPDDVFDHIVEVLPFGSEVITGRRDKRIWRLGNRDIDPNMRILVGQVGWEATGTGAADKYDPERQAWEDAVGDRGRTARAPFVFDGVTRILAVLKHPTFDEKTIPYVFRTLLQQGERTRPNQATDWDVEPIGDTATFKEWLRTTDVVQKVQFVAKMPNPDGLDAFGLVWHRMAQHRARVLKEIMEAENWDIGLVELEDDRVVDAYLAMSENAFGYVTADGTRDGKRTRFDQRSQVARHHTEELPGSWMEVVGVLVDVVRERRRRREAQQH